MVLFNNGSTFGQTQKNKMVFFGHNIRFFLNNSLLMFFCQLISGTLFFTLSLTRSWWARLSTAVRREFTVTCVLNTAALSV